MMDSLERTRQEILPASEVAVWDPAIRLFHWLLVALILFSWATAETGHLDWHRRSGYTVLTLVVFRILWGFLGSETARFGSFLRGPAAVFRHLRELTSRAPSATVGHNPLGALSVVALLLLLVVQTGTGLFSIDIDGIESGPLAGLVSFDAGRVAAAIHDLSFTLLEIMVALHIAAVLFYALVKRDNLVWPMVAGRKRLASPASAPALASPVRALALLAVAAAIVAAIVNLLPGLARLG